MWFRDKLPNISIIDTLRDTYERQIALLQEQLADARADAKRHCERADHAVDYLVNRVGLQAISEVGKRQDEVSVQRITERLSKASRNDPFDDCAFDTGDGIFKTREEAALTDG